MKKVIFGKNKIVLATYSEETKKWTKKDIEKMDKSISWFLPYQVELDRNFTVEDMIRLLHKYEEHINIIFSGYLQDSKISDFIRELDEKPDDDYIKKISYIEFYWDIDLFPLEDTEFAEFKVELYRSFRGVYPDDGDPNEALITFDEFIDLDLIALRNFKKVKLQLNDIAEFISLDIGNSMASSILDGQLTWTVFDVISAFLSEISIYGKPEEQKKFREEIIKEIEELENTQGTIEIKDLFEYLDSLDPVAQQ